MEVIMYSMLEIGDWVVENYHYSIAFVLCLFGLLLLFR